MSQFEYISIPFSIILALALGKLLTGITANIESNRRDWLALLWCGTLVLLGLTNWLNIWGLHANEVWSKAEFFLVMMSPILLYSASHILVSSNPESIDSWSSHLERVARPFLILLLLTWAIGTIRSSVVLDEPLPGIGSGLIVFLIVAAVNLAAIIHPKRWLSTALAVTNLVFVILSIVSGDLA